MSDTASEYAVGDSVEVETPNGWFHGRVAEVFPSYGWTGETRYEIRGERGHRVQTICSARWIKKATRSG